MTQLEKKLWKWKETKPPYVEKNEVFSILKRFGFEYREKSGSHVIVSHPALLEREDYGKIGCFTIAIKSGRKIKYVYLKNIIEAIEIIMRNEEI